MTNIENFNDVSEQSTQANKPAAILVFDQDGNPVEVEVLGPTQVQDVEYTDGEKDNH